MNGKNKRTLTKKAPKLGGVSKKIYDCMLIEPTRKHIIDATGMPGATVDVYINRLIKKGYVERVRRGFYNLNKNEWVLSQRRDNSDKLNKRIKNNQKTSDYMRVHNLEIKLNTTTISHKIIKALLFRKQTFTNIRPSGSNKGYFFEVGNITYMCTAKNLFAFFPKDWAIEGETLKDVAEKLYDQIYEEIHVLESRYRIILVKDNRISFDIRNIHIALVRNQVAKEMRKSGIKDLVVYDDDDGKPRFIMDLSKGLHELEAIHPEKAFDDADEAQYFMDKLKDGNIRKMIDDSGKIDNLITLNNSFGVKINQLTDAINNYLQTNTEVMKGTHMQISALAQTTNMLIKMMGGASAEKATNDEIPNEGVPDYIN